MKENLLVLKKSPLFRGVEESEFASLTKCLNGTFKTYSKGQTIYNCGDAVKDIGVVVSGRVHITKEDIWGNSNIIAEAAAGDMFAEAFVCGGVEAISVSVLAASDTEIWFINFQKIITTCPSACVFHIHLIKNMITEFARKNIMLSSKMEHITKRTTKDKLLSYLSEQMKLQGGNAFEIPFNRQELADYLSVERSALSAEMSRLKSAGVIDYRKNRFEIFSAE
jgi:CRP-like cAMP-binding protein